MFNQTFSFIDLSYLFVLILLEGLLSIDNALILSAIAQKLPLEKRKKALFVGSFTAFIFRLLGILFAAYLIHLLWIRILGGLYLLYLSLSFFFSRKKKMVKSIKPRSFFRTVLQIEMIDFVFAIDSILAGIALIGISFSPGQTLPPKLWIVYLGGIVGLLIMRFAAYFFTGIIEKFPALEKSAHLLIGWLGLKLFFLSDNIWMELFFWVGVIFFLSFGFFSTKKEKN